MNNLPIIVIGAGASGLIVCKKLLKQGKKIILLEARDRVGGRIHSFKSGEHVFEAGAEFIHGNLPLTIGLLHEYKIKFFHTAGVMARIEKGKVKKTDEFIEGWDKLMQEMSNLKSDLPLTDFLSQHFSDEKFDKLRETVGRFAEGFDLADPATASTLSLYQEWVSEGEEEQYRIPDGYNKLIDAMLKDCTSRGCELHLSTQVTKIEWEKDFVKVRDTNGREFSGSQVVVTVPLGVLQSGDILFAPEIPQLKVVHQIGFGTVIKMLFECSSAFWENNIKKLGFIFSDQVVPTWWTQLPMHQPMLTGWLGGSRAKQLERKSDDELLEIAIQSLANIFDESAATIQSHILKSNIFNWSKDPYALGAYSFPTVETRNARKILNEPIEHTIFLAGEALFDGPCGGTVEAAFKSGTDIAKKICDINS